MVLGLFYSSFVHVLEVLVGKLRLSYEARFYGLKSTAALQWIAEEYNYGLQLKE